MVAAMVTARIAAVLAALLLIPVAVADAKPATVKVMTRNLYLGADLGPGMNAKDLQGLSDGAGQILNQVDANDFNARAKGLANEIAGAKPGLIGLQEAALWRTEPCDKTPIPPSATTVRYDYVKSLLSELSKRGQHYTVAAIKPEFDFEIWANTDGNEQTAGPGCPLGSEINGRLTMRDAILVRRGVKTSHPKTGTFDTLRQVKPAGVAVNITRGWASVDATVAGHRFHFVDTHLEAFDNSASNSTNKGKDVGNGEVRAAQAKELVATGGPARSKLPVVLVGDLNSDVKTEVKKGDALAYRALLNAKFVERSTYKPLGCCLNADVLKVGSGASLKDFDHKVDHVMTSSPKKVTLVKSTVTGRSPFQGYWDSDHAGLVSLLRLN
jgi:endonuclease/exonuclease/phosphatase family metal-dependent hydrolase